MLVRVLLRLMLLTALASSVPLLSQTSPAVNGICNVRTFGAKGDASVLDTAAITNAIHACSQSGGGIVLFPAGTYLTGTFELVSNITLQLDAGAVILGSPNISDYAKLADYSMGRTYGVNS